MARSAAWPAISLRCRRDDIGVRSAHDFPPSHAPSVARAGAPRRWRWAVPALASPSLPPLLHVAFRLVARLPDGFAVLVGHRRVAGDGLAAVNRAQLELHRVAGRFSHHGELAFEFAWSAGLAIAASVSRRLR